MIVTTPEALEQLVKEYRRFDTVVFDLETMYDAPPEEQERFDLIHEQPQRLWTPDDKAWVDVFKLKATDTQANTTIWFGMATAGRSDAVATGHPKGDLIRKGGREEVIACEYFTEDDDRYWTPGGKPSTRKVEVNIPDEFSPPPPQLNIDDACEIMQPLFFDGDRRIVNQNLKFDIKSLVRAFGDFIPGPYGDTMIAQHLIDENAFMQLQLGQMVERHFGHTYDKLGSKGVHNFSFNAAARYAEQDAKFTWLLWKKYERLLRREGLFDLFEFEMEVMELLMRKEYDGAYVDRKAMEITRASYEKRKAATVEELRANYPVPPTFNFDSAPQKAELLYTQLKAPVLKKTDGGKPSTDAATLEKLAVKEGQAGEVAKLLLDYAETSKVIGTYFVGMGAKLDPNGYLHPDFTQHVADTNRLSCVVGETLVKTRRGDVPIIDVVVGDEVLTHQGRWRKVVAHIDQGQQWTVKVHSEHGAVIHCAEDHRLWTPNGWVEAGDLNEGDEIYASIEAVHQRPGQHQEGCGCVLRQGSPSTPSDSEGSRDALPQRPSHCGGARAGGGQVRAAAQAEVTGYQGCEQPDARTARPSASSVQRGARDGRRVPAETHPGREAALAPSSHGGGVGVAEAPSMGRGAPHRRQQDEQQLGQLGADDSTGTQRAPWAVGSVYAVTPGGLRQVYDLTVADDESYAAGGFLNHNCREPNVHNIPRESDMRDMFVAPKGYVVIGADYDQIELRFICAESQDPTMQEVFLSGEDVHATTAALVLNLDLEDVTSEQRTLYGKMPNFLIGYGGTAYTLAEKTGIGEKEADVVLRSYFSRFARINPWKDEVYDEALSRVKYRDGKLIVPPYVQTMMGYRRRLPGLLVNPKAAGGDRKKWREMNKIRSRAERQAVNSITQGSAAETLKIAMLDIDRHCRTEGFPMRLALNIHDEVVCYCEERHAEEGLEIVESLMGAVVNPFTGEPPLRDFVPLLASGYISDRWQKG